MISSPGNSFLFPNLSEVNAETDNRFAEEPELVKLVDLRPK